MLTRQLLGGSDVPKTEFRLQLTIPLAGRAPGDERLRVDGLPVLKLRGLVAVGDLFDERGRIDRRKQSAALEVVGDDACDTGADFAVRRRSRHEVRDRDRQGCDIAFGDHQFGLGAGP